MRGISVIICCYNSAARIKETLLHLFRQLNIGQQYREIILVDNASTDNTAEVARNVYNNYAGDKPAFKIVSEQKPGLSNARLKGVAEAAFDYLVFCDDDNWLCENYLSLALEIMLSNKDLAVLGGCGEPVFEKEQPPYFWKNQFYLMAVGPQTQHSYEDVTNTRKVVYGAGMVVDKHKLTELFEKYDITLQSSDRSGNNMMAGGDYEICLALGRIGYRIAATKDLKFKHFIPGKRSTIPYYKMLTKGFGLSQPATLVYLLNKRNYKSYKFDYRYLLLRYTKNIILYAGRLLVNGYFFSSQKYRHIELMQGFYTNYGAFLATLQTKNQYKNRFIKSKLFQLT